MVHAGDEQPATLTVTIQRNSLGGFELACTSTHGSTVYFDSPKDALRRWNAWVLASRYSLCDPEGLTAELIETNVPEASDGHDVQMPLARAAVRGRVVCVGDNIHIAYSGLERRNELRVSSEDVSWLLGVRILYADHVAVCDISSTGILIETQRELKSGITIPIELFGKKGALPLAAKVVRSRRFVQGDIVWFETACRFKRSVDLQHLVPRFLDQSRSTGVVANLR